MTETACPRCGSKTEARSAQGLCPRCLLAAASGEPSAGASSPGEVVVTGAAPRRPEAPTPEQLAPHFPALEIQSLIAVGGMGAVFRAQQKSLGRPVALKVLHAEIAGEPGFAERFQREARTLASLSHPGLVAVHDFGQAGPFFYFVMELVDGASLRQMIRAKSVEPAAALKLVMQICEVLQYAHDHGVVHRDIKPENILVDRAGRVKVLDFGLSKVVGTEAQSPLLTRTSQVMGTPHYMAPEQWEKPLEVDHRADIYALGVVFYEMLTGELPLGRFAPPSRKVEIDVRLDEVVLRTLDKEPERRYQHASDVRDDVEHISRVGGPPPAPTGIPPIPEPAELTPEPAELTPEQRVRAARVHRAKERRAEAEAASLGSKSAAALHKVKSSVGALGGRESLPGPLIAVIVFYALATLAAALGMMTLF